MNDSINLNDYKNWIESLKAKISSAKSKVAVTVNTQLIELYWEIGKEISKKSLISNWGSGVIEQISLDLAKDFPEMKGFSRRNLYAIKQWFEFYNQQYEFVPQLVAQIPWGHNRLIINKIKDISEAIYYCDQIYKNGWSRDVLDNQIEKDLYKRNSLSSHNFQKHSSRKTK